MAPLEKPDSYEPPYSVNSTSHFAYEPEWTTLQLISTLKCSKLSCGQLSVFHAAGSLEWNANERNEQYYEAVFRITAVHPSPRIIQLPSSLPEPIEGPLLAAFETFWNNKQLCANATRQAVEALLDFHGAPRLSAKSKRLPLATRIDALIKTNPNYGELFDLFRPILNAGSHGEEIKTDTLLDVLEALELHLDAVFESKIDRLGELQTLLRNPIGESDG
ncbi:DUF4145 domain-containing protein [Sulfitobacter noctilucae]|uniref:DUF4145 domain-containing protein n=1 Tax=Sulfitobacter noctilucae TaxID=1342302 RepID=UPI00046AE8B7|nr:DUF4145 domain-containing protein [Sulfitobacter noctilucae]